MIDWQALARAEVHPLRLRILETLDADASPRSPISLAKELDEPLGNVSYHVSRLRKLGLIEETHVVPRRGAVEHFYRLSEGAKA